MASLDRESATIDSKALRKALARASRGSMRKNVNHVVGEEDHLGEEVASRCFGKKDRETEKRVSRDNRVVGGESPIKGFAAQVSFLNVNGGCDWHHVTGISVWPVQRKSSCHWLSNHFENPIARSDHVASSISHRGPERTYGGFGGCPAPRSAPDGERGEVRRRSVVLRV